MSEHKNKPFPVEPDGILQFGGARMALLDIEAGFWSIRRQMDALIGSKLTDAVLQQAGANGGSSFAKFMEADRPPEEQGRLFESCLKAYESAGFGLYSISESSWPIGRVVVRGKNTIESWMTLQHDQKRENPVCAYTSGVLVGFINRICDRRDVVCVEKRCQALGADYCEFELLPASEAGSQDVVAISPDPLLGRQLNLLEMLFERLPIAILLGVLAALV